MPSETRGIVQNAIGAAEDIGHGFVDRVDSEDGNAKVHDLRKKLLDGTPDHKDKSAIQNREMVWFNRTVIGSWPLFCMFLLSQPWLSNYLNNKWYNYSAEYDAFGDNGTIASITKRKGMCITPADEMTCTDGQNFTALAIAARGEAIGCGCGQGVLGEGLCPMTSYGYTLSDFVSTGPAIATMLGLGFFPLLGTWVNTMMVNDLAQPTYLIGMIHFFSMVVFQSSYILWSIASDCIFPTAHAILTVLFLGAFLAHWVCTAGICLAKWGLTSWEARVTLFVAIGAITVITLGAIPRVFLTLNMVLGKGIFPNWNRGIGAYAFWMAEALGLSLTFGAYPMVLIAYVLTDSPEERDLFALTTGV